MNMKRKRLYGQRILALLMVLMLLIGMFPVSAFAENESETGTECICETACTEGNVNSECSVCAGDYMSCKANSGEDVDELQDGSTGETAGNSQGETTSETTDETTEEGTSENSQGESAGASVGETTDGTTGDNYIITEWEYNDSEKYLTYDEITDTWVLALGGADTEDLTNNPTMKNIIEMLPVSIMATVGDADGTQEITLSGWSCENYPATDPEKCAVSQAPSGSYIFTAALPEGYTLADGAATLTVTVNFGDVSALAESESGIMYLDKDGKECTVDSSKITSITSETTTWGEADEETWYVVDGDITINNKINVYGNVNLILKDGCKITCEAENDSTDTGNIYIEDSSLTIYAQNKDENKMGKLVVNRKYWKTSEAAIHVNGDNSALTINGGNISATSYNGAGIGGYQTGKITINGGVVEAASTRNDDNSYSAGIGGAGQGSRSGNIVINGGNVTATSYRGRGIGSASIHGSAESGYDNITINGGTVTATGGIGTDSCETISINGGTVTATGGIGTGSCETISISGGTVTATGGIGTGGCKKIDINEGTVTASGKIGSSTACNRVLITNSVVSAENIIAKNYSVRIKNAVVWTKLSMGVT